MSATCSSRLRRRVARFCSRLAISEITTFTAAWAATIDGKKDRLPVGTGIVTEATRPIATASVRHGDHRRASRPGVGDYLHELPRVARGAEVNDDITALDVDELVGQATGGEAQELDIAKDLLQQVPASVRNAEAASHPQHEDTVPSDYDVHRARDQLGCQRRFE